MKKFKLIGKLPYTVSEYKTKFKLGDLTEGRNLYKDHIIFKDEGLIKVFNRICDHNRGRICDYKGKLVCPMHNWEFNPETSSYSNIQFIKKEEEFEIVGDDLVTISKNLIPSLPKSISSKEIKISFISHACLIIESEDFSFATDPWIIGFAFASGWWLTNKPVKDWEEKLNSVDFIYISHNHPDHLNKFTLSKIRNDMTFVIPPYKSKSVEILLNKYGFKNLSLLDFDTHYKLSDSGLNFSIFKSGDFRDDSGFYFTYGNFSMLSTVDSNNLNFFRFPVDITLIASSFAGGASGYPLCFENLSELKKVKILNRNKLVGKSTVKEIVSLTKAAYFLPYAGFFTEKAKRDIYIKKNNVKNSICDFEEIYHEQLLNIWNNDQFVFKSNKLTSKSNLERHNSHNLVEDFYEDIFNKIEVSNSYLEDYFLKSSFRDKLKIYVQLTDDTFSKIYKMISVDFSSDKPIVSFKSFDWEKEKWQKDTIKSNRKLLIKVRQDSFNWVVNNKFPWEDLSIGFQCRIYRNPDVYNVKFWEYFTNVYIN